MDIILTDGYREHEVMDVLGRGSVIGANNVVKGELWYYECINSTTQSNKCISLSWATIQQVM